ncbi:novel acetylcholine receptor chaperone-like, partial [Ruditapes philippinarum]|uniref:novel acetylcholine receptor chaperone-like n=1 Tax=Ruditapes philippinarum TaxID=129788 RepID=UPI00295BB857
GFSFLFVGFSKLSPAINKELYKEMRKQYIRMAKVFPLVSLTGWKPNAHIYRKIIASIEITCGAILVLIPGPLKVAANILMILVNANDVLAHSQIKDGLQRMSLPIVFMLLLTCRLLIQYQENRREKKLLEEKLQKQSESNGQEQKTTEETSPEVKKTQ